MDSIADLEKAMDKMNEELPDLKNFILPGGDKTASFCHIARCVCRRAERICVAMQDEGQLLEDYVIIYLNRLSDYLFVLSRFILLKNNGIERDEILESVEYFMNIKRTFSADPYSKTIPLNEVTPNLVALCVRYSEDTDITDDEYFQIVEEAKTLSLNYFS